MVIHPMRRWHYEHGFLGKQHIDFPMGAVERAIKRELNIRHGENWKRDTLKKGKQVTSDRREKR